MYETVSNSAIMGMVCSLAISFLFPIALLIYWKISKKPKLVSFFIGAGVFIVFALVLEQILHTVVMMAVGGGDLLAGNEKMSSNIWLYGLYGGICAAVFEEVGRFLAMKFCMKKFLDKENAIMYGIGHGGIEAMIIIGLAEISNIATALAVNSGAIDVILGAVSGEQKDALYEQISGLWTTPASGFYFAGVERIIAITLHICLSYMVYRFVKYNEKKCFVIALAAHFLIDFVTVILGSVAPIAVLEAILAVAVVVFLVFVVKMYKSEEN